VYSSKMNPDEVGKCEGQKEITTQPRSTILLIKIIPEGIGPLVTTLFLVFVYS
jgi:hypothetical protein